MQGLFCKIFILTARRADFGRIRLYFTSGIGIIIHDHYHYEGWGAGYILSRKGADMGIFDMQTFFVTLIVLVTSLPAHEFAHAWMAYKLGDDTAARQGRLDLNPLRHLDPIGALMLILTQRFGWAKPVPGDPRRCDRRSSVRAGMARSSLAGPAANVILALLSLLAAKILMVVILVTNTGGALAILEWVFITMASINVSLAVFNLLPVPPLDGFSILTFFVPAKWEYKVRQYQQVIYIVLLVLVVSGALNVPLMFLSNLLFKGLNFLTGFVNVIAGMIL